MEGLCTCFNTMMVKFYFGSTFLNGFEVLRCLERYQMKKKNCAKCRAEIYFIIFVQRAGVVSKTNINVKEKKKLIAFMQVWERTESCGSLWILIIFKPHRCSQSGVIASMGCLSYSRNLIGTLGRFTFSKQCLECIFIKAVLKKPSYLATIWHNVLSMCVILKHSKIL